MEKVVCTSTVLGDGHPYQGTVALHIIPPFTEVSCLLQARNLPRVNGTRPAGGGSTIVQQSSEHVKAGARIPRTTIYQKIRDSVCFVDVFKAATYGVPNRIYWSIYPGAVLLSQISSSTPSWGRWFVPRQVLGESYPCQDMPYTTTLSEMKKKIKGTQQQQYLFLTAFSALPGRSLEISDHLLPSRPWASHSTTSSPPVHALFLTRVSRWFSQRSRHCFPDLPGNWVAIKLLRGGARRLLLQRRAVFVVLLRVSWTVWCEIEVQVSLPVSLSVPVKPVEDERIGDAGEVAVPEPISVPLSTSRVPEGSWRSRTFDTSQALTESVLPRVLLLSFSAEAGGGGLGGTRYGM